MQIPLEENMNNEVFFVNDCWNYMKREVNINTFTISYKREGGFSRKDKAERSKQIELIEMVRQMAVKCDIAVMSRMFLLTIRCLFQRIFRMLHASLAPARITAT